MPCYDSGRICTTRFAILVSESVVLLYVRLDAKGKADKDLDLYCKLMAEVKGRLYAALEILKGHTRTSYKVTNIEFVCLQIRKVLELISMCSLVANSALNVPSGAFSNVPSVTDSNVPLQTWLL